MPFQSALERPQLVFCLWFWTLNFRNDTEKWEMFHRQVTKMIKGLEWKLCQERLREQGRSDLEERLRSYAQIGKGGGSTESYDTLGEG